MSSVRCANYRVIYDDLVPVTRDGFSCSARAARGSTIWPAIAICPAVSLSECTVRPFGALISSSLATRTVWSGGSRLTRRAQADRDWAATGPGQRPATGGQALQAPAFLVDLSMVRAAQQDQVGHRRRSLVDPVLDVMRVGP